MLGTSSCILCDFNRARVCLQPENSKGRPDVVLVASNTGGAKKAGGIFFGDHFTPNGTKKNGLT